MGEVTVNNIVAALAIIIVIFNFYDRINSIFGKPKKKINNRLYDLERQMKVTQEDGKSSKIERKILCQGILACLRGLQEQGVNGPVTKGIHDLEEYLMNSAHD